jgi:protein gp37
MGKSPIEWTEFTWNPLAGCNRITPGCAGCYARTLHQMRHNIYRANNGLWPRAGKPIAAQYALPFETIQLFPERLSIPIKRKEPTMWFVNSMSDLFHKDVPIEFIQAVFQTMNETPRHTYQVLTKRHERLAEIAASGAVTWTDNIWQGVSIENNRFVVRANYLRQVPARTRFISAEPLLTALPDLDLAGIAWLIAGGESGNKARPMNPAWVYELRDKCRVAGTAFFFKQWGEWLPYDHNPKSPMFGVPPESLAGEKYSWTKVGKKAAGRLLDGRTWDEMPQLDTALS